MPDEIPRKLRDICKKLDYNMGRATDLIRLYELTVENRKFGTCGFEMKRESIAHEDILRGALVLLHASLEEFFRSILKWRVCNVDCELITKHLIHGGKAIKLKKIKGCNLSDAEIRNLIKDEVNIFLRKEYRIGKGNKLVRSLKAIGVDEKDVEECSFCYLREMICRRNNIVHNADRETFATERSHSVTPIGVETITKQASEIRSVRKFVIDNLEKIMK